MKFTVSAADARGVVALVKDVVPSKAVTQEATGILVQARDTGLILTAVGAEMFITANCPAKVSEEGTFCVNGYVLSDVVSSFTPLDEKKGVGTSDLSFELDVRSRVVLIKAKTKYGSKTVNHKRKVPLLDADMFPAIPKFAPDNSFSFPPLTLKRGVESTYPAVSAGLSDAIGGLHLRVSGGIFTSVGTDTLKLSEYEEAVPGVQDFSVIVPPRFALKAAKCISTDTSEVTVAVTKNIFWVAVPGVTVGGVTIRGSYPDYKALLMPSKMTLVVDRKVLLDNISNLDYGSFEDNRVTMKLTPGSLVTATSMAENESIDVEFASSFQLSFDLLHLSSVVKNTPGEAIEVGFVAPDKPATFRGVGEGSIKQVSTILMAMKD